MRVRSLAMKTTALAIFMSLPVRRWRTPSAGTPEPAMRSGAEGTAASQAGLKPLPSNGMGAPGAATRAKRLAAPANQTLPLLIFAATEVRTTPFFGGLTKHELDVEFQIQYATPSPLDAYNVADAISTALSTPMSVTGFDAARATRVSRGVPSFTDDGWTMIERWRVVAHDI